MSYWFYMAFHVWSYTGFSRSLTPLAGYGFNAVRQRQSALRGIPRNNLPSLMLNQASEGLSERKILLFRIIKHNNFRLIKRATMTLTGSPFPTCQSYTLLLLVSDIWNTRWPRQGIWTCDPRVRGQVLLIPKPSTPIIRLNALW